MLRKRSRLTSRAVKSKRRAPILACSFRRALSSRFAVRPAPTRLPRSREPRDRSIGAAIATRFERAGNDAGRAAIDAVVEHLSGELAVAGFGRLGSNGGDKRSSWSSTMVLRPTRATSFCERCSAPPWPARRNSISNACAFRARESARAFSLAAGEARRKYGSGSGRASPGARRSFDSTRLSPAEVKRESRTKGLASCATCWSASSGVRPHRGSRRRPWAARWRVRGFCRGGLGGTCRRPRGAASHGHFGSARSASDFRATWVVDLAARLRIARRIGELSRRATRSPSVQLPTVQRTERRTGSGAASAPGGSISDAGPISAPEDEEGPPSAPRLREVPEEEMPAEERDRDEEEPQLKTPPPESGRQHVTPGPAPTISEADEDISITVTMEESEVPPSVSEREPESAPMPMSAGSRQEIPELSGPQPRLALVSEPEIELHGMTPISSGTRSSLACARRVACPRCPSRHPFGRPPDGRNPLAAPPAPPAPPPPALARTRAVGASTPAVGRHEPARRGRAAPSPPVRLMAQPLGDASGKPLPPVEVWASTFTPRRCAVQVASFVGQNANFEPKTFGELVRASIALGEDKS